MQYRVLVVDDSATVRRIVGRTLGQAGYEVVLAVDGRDGFDKAQAAVPDLVLVDFVMPQMNGFQFVQAMRGVSNLRAVPVVLMSAKADRIGDGFVAQTGAIDAITKPFSPEALLTVTGHALSRAREASSAVAVSPPIEKEPARANDVSTESSTIELPRAASAIAGRLRETIAPLVPREVAEGLAERIVERYEPRELFALVEQLAASLPGHDGQLALRGEIEHFPLGDVLQVLQHQRQTGVLEVQREDPSRVISICLRDGSVELALGNANDREEFRIGHYLVREQLIERDDLERIVRNRPRGLLGAHLVRLGYLSPDELMRLLIQQTSELIYDALRWPRGSYRFLRFATRPEATDAKLHLPLAAILMEGLRRVDEWRLIEEQLRSFDDVPRRDEEALRYVDFARFSGDERRVLDAIDGSCTVREIVERSHLGSFEACKILFQLLTSRLVRV